MNAYGRLVDACHELAAAKFGKGAAISVDKEGQDYLCRVWNPKGGLALIGPSDGRNKADAFRKLKNVLKDTRPAECEVPS